MTNFWTKLPQPFFALAPMEDVTDTVFRQIVGSCAPPDVYFTEFTSIDGLLSKGCDAVSHRLTYSKGERPIVAQIWGSDPEKFHQVARLLRDMKFDGIDINMGCPHRKIVKTGTCSALIDDPEKAVEIINATIKGAGSLPVSVKTRIGFKKIKTEEWIQALLATDIAALTIHGCTAKELSKVPAHWDEIGKAVTIRNNLKSKTLIIGNGNVMTRVEGLEKIERYGLDGIMIGRGVFGNPWVFAKKPYMPSKEELLKKLIEHVELFNSTWGSAKNFAIIKKFFKVYVRGFDGATGLRTQLMQANSAQAVKQRIDKYMEDFSWIGNSRRSPTQF